MSKAMMEDMEHMARELVSFMEKEELIIPNKSEKVSTWLTHMLRFMPKKLEEHRKNRLQEFNEHLDRLTILQTSGNMTLTKEINAVIAKINDELGLS